ncbi:MAG TPA: alpha/beta hydrolase-fold protein [Kangiella sp.]
MSGNFKYSVHLPISYAKSESRSYPVVYLIDSNSFYLGDYFTDAQDAIRQLEKFHDIPESIIVDVKIDKLYQNVTSDRNKLTQWLTTDLTQQISNGYRTHNQQTVIGFSYTAGGLMNSLALQENPFTALISLSPVFESVDDIPSSLSNPRLNTEHYIVFGNEEHRLMEFYQPLWESADSKASLSIISHPRANHQSVLIPGLRDALLATFQSYHMPSYAEFSHRDYTPQELTELFKKRKAQYGVESSSAEFSELATTAAKIYTKAGKFDLAEQHWRNSDSEHKSYFIEQIISEFERSKQSILADKARNLRQNLDL